MGDGNILTAYYNFSDKGKQKNEIDRVCFINSYALSYAYRQHETPTGECIMQNGIMDIVVEYCAT